MSERDLSLLQTCLSAWIAPAEMSIVAVSGQWTYVLVYEQATAKLVWVRVLQ
jgi:hypothetical protein